MIDGIKFLSSSTFSCEVMISNIIYFPDYSIAFHFRFFYDLIPFLLNS